MKALVRLLVPLGMVGLLFLAGCNLPRPNIPQTGLTPGYPYPQPAGTGTPGLPGAIPVTPSANTAVPGATQPAATPGETGSIPLPAQREEIRFPANATSYVVTTDLQQGGTRAYQVSARAGQRMFITIDGNASMQLYDPNLSPISGVLNALNPVQISLSQDGPHYIALQGQGPVAMSVYIPPEGGNQNIPAPVPAQLETIRFRPGATSASFSGNMTAGAPLGYRLNAQAGQPLTVTTQGNVTVTLLAPDGATMVPSGPAPTHQWSYLLPESGDYTLVLLGNGPVSITVSIAPLGSPPPGGQGTAIPRPGSSTRVSFPPGNASVTLNANLAAGQPQAYVLRLQAGQALYVSTTGSVDVTIYGPDDTVLTSGHADFPNLWSAPAGQAGDYTFVVAGEGASTLTFYVPPE